MNSTCSNSWPAVLVHAIERPEACALVTELIETGRLPKEQIHLPSEGSAVKQAVFDHSCRHIPMSTEDKGALYGASIGCYIALIYILLTRHDQKFFTIPEAVFVLGVLGLALGGMGGYFIALPFGWGWLTTTKPQTTTGRATTSDSPNNSPAVAQPRAEPDRIEMAITCTTEQELGVVTSACDRLGLRSEIILPAC